MLGRGLRFALKAKGAEARFERRSHHGGYFCSRARRPWRYYYSEVPPGRGTRTESDPAAHHDRYPYLGMSKHPPRTLPEPRPLSQWERAVLERLITFVPMDARSDLVDQLDELRVISECQCGCLTIDFASWSVSHRRIYGAADDSDEMLISFILHETEGRLTELEVFRGDSGPVRVPPALHTIDRVEWDELGRGRGAVMRRVPVS